MAFSRNSVAVFAIVGLFVWVHADGTVNTGLKVKITQSGLAYAEKSLVENLVSKIKGRHIDDQHGDANIGHIGKIYYDLTNLRISAFNRPTSHMSVLPGNGLKWQTSGGYILLQGDWKYTNHGWIKIRDHGSFDVSVYDIDFQVGVKLGMDPSGRPSIAVSQCNGRIGKVSVKFHGGASWLYNLFKGSIGRSIEGKISALLCPEATKQINGNAENHLAKLKLVTKLGNDFELDYRLTQSPQFFTGYLESFHKGALRWIGDKTDPPVKAPIMPGITGMDRMVYIEMSDYIMNTIGYVLHKRGLLRYDLTRKDVPEKQQHYFDTSCEGSVASCIGRIVPEIGEKFPNCTVSMDLRTTEPPTLSVLNGKILGQFKGNLRFFVTHPKSMKNIYVFTAASVLNMTLNISAQEEKLTANVGPMWIDFNVTDSAIGNISTRGLQFVGDLILNAFIRSHLNEVGNRGIPIPKFDNVRLVSTRIELLKDSIVIGSDVEYI